MEEGFGDHCRSPLPAVPVPHHATGIRAGYPNDPAPRLSLVDLYRWLSMRDRTDGAFDRNLIRTAIDLLKQATVVEDPPQHTTLSAHAQRRN